MSQKKAEKRRARAKIVKLKLEARRQRLRARRAREAKELEREKQLDKEARELGKLVKPEQVSQKASELESSPAVDVPPTRTAFNKSAWLASPSQQSMPSISKQGFNKAAWKVGENVNGLDETKH